MKNKVQLADDMHVFLLERLLRLFMERNKAEAIVGDLREISNDHGPLWFFKESVRLLVSLSLPTVGLISFCALIYMFEMGLLSRLNFLSPRTIAIGNSISRCLHLEKEPGIAYGFTKFWDANTEILMGAVLPLVLRFGIRSKMAVMALILWIPLALASATHDETFFELALAMNLATIGIFMSFRSWRRPLSILLVAFLATTGTLIPAAFHLRPELIQLVGDSMVRSTILFYGLAWSDLAVFMVICVSLNRLWQIENGQQAAV